MRAAVAIGAPRAVELLRHLAAALRWLARPPSRPVARWLLALGLVAVVLGGVYTFWFRDSSFVRVERVTVTGLTGTKAPARRAALVAAAKRMTTLHVDEAELRRALAAGLTVDAVRVTPDFPHALRIEVVEKAPVAVVVYGSERVAVGTGAVLLPDIVRIPSSLPAIEVGALPPAGRLGRGRDRRLVAAAAAAPAPLRARVYRLREIPVKGLVAYVRNGPDVFLGAATDLRAKWTAAAAILADGTSRGASYIDVRVADRPVAGGLQVAPAPLDTQPPSDTAPAAPSPTVSPTPPVGTAGAAATTPAAPSGGPASAPAAQPPATAPAPTQGTGTGGAATAPSP